MANPTQTQTAAPKVEEFDRKVITRHFARLRHEVGGLVDDSYRQRPFYAPTQEAAIAKREAAIKALNSLADQIDQIKREGN